MSGSPSGDVALARIAALLNGAREWAEGRHAAWPAALESARLLAIDGQTRPDVACSNGCSHTPDMLTLSYADTGLRLGVSERTVRRLAADGVLPTVLVGGHPRVRAADLVAYVEHLPVHNARKAA